MVKHDPVTRGGWRWLLMFKTHGERCARQQRAFLATPPTRPLQKFKVREQSHRKRKGCGGPRETPFVEFRICCSSLQEAASRASIKLQLLHEPSTCAALRSLRCAACAADSRWEDEELHSTVYSLRTAVHGCTGSFALVRMTAASIASSSCLSRCQLVAALLESPSPL